MGGNENKSGARQPGRVSELTGIFERWGRQADNVVSNILRRNPRPISSQNGKMNQSQFVNLQNQQRRHSHSAISTSTSIKKKSSSENEDVVLLRYQVTYPQRHSYCGGNGAQNPIRRRQRIVSYPGTSSDGVQSLIQSFSNNFITPSSEGSDIAAIPIQNSQNGYRPPVMVQSPSGDGSDLTASKPIPQNPIQNPPEKCLPPAPEPIQKKTLHPHTKMGGRSIGQNHRMSGTMLSFPEPVVVAPNQGFNSQLAEPMGIEGKNNSSYMDSTLVSLFLFNPAFSSCLSDGGRAISQNRKKVRRILQNEILEPLHHTKKLELSSGIMKRFRKAMSKYNTSYYSIQMDPEVFIETLFRTVLEIPPFFQLSDSPTGNYIFQNFGEPIQMGSFEDTVLLSGLLHHAFTSSKTFLKELPSPGWIIKLPHANGKRTYPKILPNLEISLENILPPPRNPNMRMALSAVICLKDNHFTTFVSTGKIITSDWVYLDSYKFSKPEKVDSMVTLLLDPLTHQQAQAQRILMQKPLLDFLLRNAYICVYLPVTQVDGKLEYACTNTVMNSL